MAATNSKARDGAQRGARGQVLSRRDRWRSYRLAPSGHTQKQRLKNTSRTPAVAADDFGDCHCPDIACGTLFKCGEYPPAQWRR